MTSLLRRLAVPLVGASLVLVVILVPFVVLDLGGSGGDSAALTAIQIGSTPAAQEAGATAPAGSTTVTSSSSPLEGPGAGVTQSPNVPAGPGSTIRAGKTTVVTGGIRVQPGPGYQDGSTTTTRAEGPDSNGPVGNSTTTTGVEGPTSTGGPYGSTSTTGAHGPSSTGEPAGGRGGPDSTGSGR